MISPYNETFNDVKSKILHYIRSENHDQKKIMAHQLKIEILDTNPNVYRTVVVPENFTFEQLHNVIQCAFNWENVHLYEFYLGRFFGSERIMPSDEFEMDEGSTKYRKYDASQTTLNDAIRKGFTSVNYIYDFGDSWHHSIKFMKKPDHEVQHPICLNGENTAPIDDCGGIPGFYDLLQTLADPNDTDEKEELLDWLGLDKSTDFEKVYGFNIDKINQKLRS